MATDVRLLPTEQDDVYRAIEKAGFDPSDFEWETLDIDERARPTLFTFRVSILKYKKNPEFYMMFGGIRCQWSPGFQVRIDNQDHMRVWPAKLTFVNTWLQNLKTQVTAENLWSTLRQEKAIAEAAESLDNEPFKEDEKLRIAATLDEIKDGIKSMQQFDSRQAAIIDDQFAYLHQGLNGWGRKDFANIFLAVVINIGTALAMENTAFRKLLDYALGTMKFVWDHAARLLN